MILILNALYFSFQLFKFQMYPTKVLLAFVKYQNGCIWQVLEDYLRTDERWDFLSVASRWCNYFMNWDPIITTNRFYKFSPFYNNLWMLLVRIKNTPTFCLLITSWQGYHAVLYVILVYNTFFVVMEKLKECDSTMSFSITVLFRWIIGVTVGH